MTSMVSEKGTLRRALKVVTYRQLVYWVMSGYITPTVRGRGSGSHHVWEDCDLARLATIATYVRTVGQPRGKVLRALWDALAPAPFDSGRWIVLPSGEVVPFTVAAMLDTPGCVVILHTGEVPS